MNLQTPTGSLVYFIQGGPKGHIKIGCTSGLAGRLKTLQASSPVELKVLGVIHASLKEALEDALHERFAKHRLHGEWFKAAPELLDYVRENAVSCQVDIAPKVPVRKAVDPDCPSNVKKRAVVAKKAEMLAAVEECRKSLAAGRGWTPLPKGWSRYVRRTPRAQKPYHGQGDERPYEAVRKGGAQ